MMRNDYGRNRLFKILAVIYKEYRKRGDKKNGIWEHCVLLANGITGMTLPQGETFTHLAQTFHNFDETTAPKEIIDKIADGTYISPYCPLVEVKYNAR